MNIQRQTIRRKVRMGRTNYPFVFIDLINLRPLVTSLKTEQLFQKTKEEVFKRLAEEKDATGPSRYTRSQIKNTAAIFKGHVKPKIARCVDTISSLPQPAFSISFKDGNERMTVQRRIDNGSKESIVSSKVSKPAVINGTGRMKMIKPTELEG